VWEFKQIKDLYLRSVARRNLFRCLGLGAIRLPIERTWKSVQFVKDLKGARLNGV